MKILAINTGGTIGMVRTERGFAPQKGVVADALHALAPASDGGLTVEALDFDPLIDSADAAPQDWNRIARAIAAGHDLYDGFLVVHGTDSMAYSAAALCFALEGLARPVVLTGSMLPLPEEDSDGACNLADALAALKSAPPGVWLQFAGKLLHGARLRKIHSTAFEAFAASPWDAPPLRPGATFRRHEYQARDIAVLTTTPGISPVLLRQAAQHCDAILLRCYGSGTVPNTAALREALLAARKRAIPVLAVSQCAEGGVGFGTYAAGNLLIEAGVIDGGDMTAEAAYAKLMLALSGDDRAGLLRSILAGERRSAEA